MVNKLELLHEGFRNEVDELDSLVQKTEDYLLKARKNFVMNALNTHLSNLNGLCDSLYSEFENDTSNEFEELQKNYAVVLSLLNNFTTDEDKLYIKLRYGIEVDSWS